MNFGEDLKMSLRSLKEKPVETLLLVLGISLGIGATAAGVSMIGSSIAEKNKVLNSTTYKEIVVQVEEESENMDQPASVVADGETIILSYNDLVAKNDVADVEYAYLANSTYFRLTNTQRAGQPFAPPELVNVAVETTTTSIPASSPASTTFSAREATSRLSEQATTESRKATSNEASNTVANAAMIAEGAPRNGFFETPEIEGPLPVLDEIAGLRVSPEYFDAWNLAPSAGSVFMESEMVDGTKVMVVGAALAETLFEDGVALGRELVVFQSIYTIVGILEPTGTSIDETAIVPAEIYDPNSIQVAFRGKLGGGASLHFTVYDSTRLDEAKAQLDFWFEQEYGADRVSISMPREEVEAAQDRTARLVTIIFFLAIAGLLIASVNVSNILLGRAMKRRNSVGILKALGATKQVIFRLFFFEALVIGASGAIVGTGMSLLISTMVSGGSIALNGVLVLGVLGAWLITTVLTLIPAVQASRISPAIALRYE